MYVWLLYCHFVDFAFILYSSGTQKASLLASLEETQLRCNMQVEQYNAIILQLEAELTELRSSIQKHRQDYSILLNLKEELEAEIETYRRHLDGQEQLVKVVY